VLTQFHQVLEDQELQMVFPSHLQGTAALEAVA
jgi:hypothetical protein